MRAKLDPTIAFWDLPPPHPDSHAKSEPGHAGRSKEIQLMWASWMEVTFLNIVDLAKRGPAGDLATGTYEEEALY